MRTSILALGYLTILSAACGLGGDDTAASEEALVDRSKVSCSIARGAFVKSSDAKPDGTLSVSCSGAKGVSFDETALVARGATYSFTPHLGLNVLHVQAETSVNGSSETEVPFLFGSYADPRASVPSAVALRLGKTAFSDGPVALPLPAASRLTISQVATQLLRDQGNLLAALDGLSKDVGSGAFQAGVKLVRSSYDPSGVVLSLSARQGGLRLDATLRRVRSQVAWSASALGIHLHDTINASVDTVRVSADIELVYNPNTHAIDARLGAHDIHVDGLSLDVMSLDALPFDLNQPIESALSGGVRELVNHFADALLDRLQSKIVPQIGLDLTQLHLPATFSLPDPIGGVFEHREVIDAASFTADAATVSLAVNVSHPKSSRVAIASPGWLRVGSTAARFDDRGAFGASLSLDFVNQALFAAWDQGVLARELVPSLDIAGFSTGAIRSKAKLPPVLLANADGSGLTLGLGQFELDTIVHDADLGDVPVRLAATLSASASLVFEGGGDSVRIILDPKRTKIAVEVAAVPAGASAVADRIEAAITQILGIVNILLTDPKVLPPIALPTIDLGLLSPAFAGRVGKLQGNFVVDPTTARFGLTGDLLVP